MAENLFRGKLVRLAASHPDDYQVMAGWWDDSEFQRLMNSDPAMPRSAEELKKDDERRSEPNYFSWRIRTLDGDRLIGFVSLFRIEWNNQAATLGVGVGERDFWGRGYGSEAIALVLNYAFNELNLHRVGLGTFSYNARAIKAYEKLGFKTEGISRETILRDGKRHDDINMGILRNEWISRTSPTKR